MTSPDESREVPNDCTDATVPRRTARDSGQATAEYALVLLGAAAIALVLLAWATGGGGSHISGFFDHIFRSITDHAG
jgi:hypothetical protein